MVYYKRLYIKFRQQVIYKSNKNIPLGKKGNKGSYLEILKSYLKLTKVKCICNSHIHLVAIMVFNFQK